MERYLAVSAFAICNILFVVSLFIPIPLILVVSPLIVMHVINTLTLFVLTFLRIIHKIINMR